MALNLKGLKYETVAVDLVAGEQRSEAYLALNPGGGLERAGRRAQSNHSSAGSNLGRTTISTFMAPIAR